MLVSCRLACPAKQDAPDGQAASQSKSDQIAIVLAYINSYRAHNQKNQLISAIQHEGKLGGFAVQFLFHDPPAKGIDASNQS